MIKPHPESDLTQNTMVLGASLIEILKSSNEKMLVDELLTKFMNKDGRRTPDQFMEALLVLYTIGLVEKEQFRVVLQERKHA